MAFERPIHTKLPFTILQVILTGSLVIGVAVTKVPYKGDPVEVCQPMRAATTVSDVAEIGIGMHIGAEGGSQEDSTSGEHKPPRPTSHFEERRAQGNRPTSQALTDAQNVRPSNLFIDHETANYVVQGPRGRIHMFRQNGAPHTSFRGTRTNTQRRVHTGRWRRATSAEHAQFLDIIQRRDR